MRRLLLATAAVALLVGLVTVPGGAQETPTLQSPSEAGTAELTFEGTVDPGASGAATSDCSAGGPEADSTTFAIEGGEAPATLATSLQVAIDWEPSAGNDLVLSLYLVEDGSRTELGSSDAGGTNPEAITVNSPEPGTYEVVACAFSNPTPQDYTGTATLTAVATETVTLPPAADPQGLAFSASVPADLQRDEGEPIVEIDPDGNIYTCGPTGFSQAEDYLQVSTDGGDQFHLLGEPPRGQQSLGGGGDCGLATAIERNDQDAFNLAYVGLSGLIDFTTSTSPDGGRTFISSPTAEGGPAVDRQWITFSDEDTVWFNYNRVLPRDITVQRSDDAGLTYGPPEPISPSPDFPGPIRAMPADLNPLGNGEPVVYYPWSQGTSLRFAVTLDGGTTWRNCTAAEAEGSPSAQFPVADHDVEGNIYIAYTDDATFNTYLVTASVDVLTQCLGASGSQTTTPLDDAAKTNPGFTAPVLVNREGVPTTVFPWLAAGGEPGRVGITYSGSPTVGRPDDAELPHTWNVYVAQSLNALDAEPSFSQVRATTHPNHYGQICLLGIGCTAGGDRSLVDFYAIDYNPANGEYVVVYNQAHKRPGDTAGTVSTPVVLHQVAGPSNGGGVVESGEPPALRSASDDPTGDAILDYSSLYTPASRQEAPALDVTRVEVGPAVDLAVPDGGEEPARTPLDGGGFTVTMRIADLSDAALEQALAAGTAQSLLWIFRYVDGYRYAAASARWNPAEGFTFGFNDYVATASECGSPSTPENPAQANDQCLQYPGNVPIDGAVDQEAGTIELTVPLELLQALEGGEGPGEQPVEVPAEPGDRVFDATVFAVTNSASPRQEVQSFLYPADNTPAMDFAIPGGETPGEVVDGPTVERYAGRERTETSAAISGRDRTSATTVVLAREDEYADALSGGPLAVQLDAPLLLSARESLSRAARDEIERLGATDAVLLGGDAALSAQVERDLEELDVTVRRVAGPNRFATAAAIAEELPAADEVLIAEGDDPVPTRGFPDALSAAGLGSVEGIPILLVVTDALPAETAAALPEDVDATIVGGAEAVSEEVAAAIDERVGTLTRLAGATRYGTSAAVAQEALARGITPDVVWVATGDDFPDGLVAGAATGRDGGLLLLVDGASLAGSPETRDLLVANLAEVETIRIAGGTAAVSAGVEEELRALRAG